MKFSIIGFGKQGKKYFNAIQNSGFSVLSILDSDKSKFYNENLNIDVPLFDSLDEFLDFGKPDIAIVCVPHNAYFQIIEKLAQRKIPILKEKPFATSVDEAKALDEILNYYKVPMMVSCQRRFDELYIKFTELIKLVGVIYHIQGNYVKNVDFLDQGWRARYKLSGGGALIDMGYHFIDVLIWNFGLPKWIMLQQNRNNRLSQLYEVEDTAIISAEYIKNKSVDRDDNKLSVNLIFSRIGHKEKEKWLVKGNRGTVVLKKNHIFLFDENNKIVFEQKRSQPFEVSYINQLTHFVNFLSGKIKTLENDYRKHHDNVFLISSAYKSSLVSKPVQTQESTQNKSKDFVWPVITDKTKQAVLKQLDTSISIYNRSGIIAEFEDKFKNYHQRTYGLLTNSGTNAIFGMYEGLGLSPGDEVIAPAYTFFATVSPLMYLGAKPIFCDCLPDGNIDPNEIRRKITPKTKAVVITHMWGIPCDMDEIQSICLQNKIYLLEDCSHAHGASYKGKKVGTFGDAAVWSLQGQKIITGGEGGILLTDNLDIYVRAQLQGQYNKRCQQEIPKNHNLYDFSLTGFGLKNRAHPLAIAIANEQFDYLDMWIKQRTIFAKEIIFSLSDIEFLTFPKIEHKSPSWYALVFQYNEKLSGLAIDQFVERLNKSGLTEVERPRSTCPIYALPLFRNPHLAFPRLYHQPLEDSSVFPMSDNYYSNAIKFPVWSFSEDSNTVSRYINTIREVCNEIIEEKKFTKGSKL